MGYSSIVSIGCDFPGCERSDDYVDSDRLDHWFLPEGWARVELQLDVEHEDHHDEASLFSLLCPDHTRDMKEQLWPGEEPERRSRR
jgi:hypothetical protein